LSKKLKEFFKVWKVKTEFQAFQGNLNNTYTHTVSLNNPCQVLTSPIMLPETVLCCKKGWMESFKKGMTLVKGAMVWFASLVQ
jgi:hypothetical protein